MKKMIKNVVFIQVYQQLKDILKCIHNIVSMIVQKRSNNIKLIKKLKDLKLNSKYYIYFN